MQASQAADAQKELSALQGIFCNTSDQLDLVLANFESGLSLKGAVDFANEKEIGCTYVDLLHFVVRSPLRTGIHHGRLSTAKFEAVLTAVIIGDEVRTVSPPASVFFVVPEPPTDKPQERRS
jgi:hypothetical protein